MRIVSQKILGRLCALAGVLTLLASAGVATTQPVHAASTTVQVFSSSLESDKTAAMSNDKWFFYNDENDTVDNTLGTFRAGPATAPLGAGSVQISVSGTQRRNLATYQFRGTALSTITTLKFSTFNPSLGNGGSADRSGYLNFNVDFDGSDTWQKRLLFAPSDNGAIHQNQWDEWDAIQGGAAKWHYSGATWPVTGQPGTTIKTWSQILSDYPGVRIRVTDSWFGIRVGSPYPSGYTENIDKIVFGVNGDDKVFDFEPDCLSTCQVYQGSLAGDAAAVLAHPAKWLFYNDENDTIDSSLGSFVSGPATPPLGAGSAQISVSGTQRRNLATYQFSGAPLATITTLKFSTFNPSAGNGGSANRSGYLNFNVDFDGSDSWQKRLVFLPSDNGTIVQNSWQEWDTIQGGAAKWRYSGATWPVTGQSGETTKTWTQILADYPGVRVRVSDSWLGIRVGEPYADGYTEDIDKFVFGTAAGTFTYDFEPDCQTTCYVNGATGSDTNSGTSAADPKKTIQAAVNSVAAGGTVNVAAGTYREQVIISKTLTLLGAGPGQSIIQSPDALAQTYGSIPGGSSRSVVAVFSPNPDSPSITPTITGFTIDGMGKAATVVSGGDNFAGVHFFGANGTLSNTLVTGIRDNPLNGMQRGTAVMVNHRYDLVITQTINILNNKITDYQKGGIVANEIGTIVNATNNTVTGAGPTPLIAANGIQYGYGASGTVSGNTVTGNSYTVTPSPWSSAGILIVGNTLSPNPARPPTILTGNTISGNQIGILVSPDTSFGYGDAVVQVTSNTVAGNAIGLENDNQTTLADASGNWWGSASGPTSGRNAVNVFNVGSQGDQITGTVKTAFVPWLNAAPPSGALFAPVTTNNPVTPGVTMFDSFTEAVAGSNAGAIITGAAGAFSEGPVLVNKQLTLRGATHGADARFRGGASGTETEIIGAGGAFNVTASGVTIDGFTIRNATAGYLGTGVNLGGATSGNQVINTIFRDNIFGLYLNASGAATTLVQHNVFKDNNASGAAGGNGIYSDGGAKNVQVLDNFFENQQNTAMVIAWGGQPNSDITVSGNHLLNTVGFYFGGTSNLTITNNVFTGTLFSAVGFAGGVNNALVSNNTLTDGKAQAVRAAVRWGPGNNANITVSNNTINQSASAFDTSDLGIIQLEDVIGSNTVASNRVTLSGAFSGAVTQTYGVLLNGAGTTNVSVHDNTLSGGNATGSVEYAGVKLGSSLPPTATLVISQNLVSGFGVGLSAQNLPSGIAASMMRNSFAGNTTGVSNTGSAAILNAIQNWWGSLRGPTTASNPGGDGVPVTTNVAYSPWLGDGTNNAGANPGFVPNLTPQYGLATQLVFTQQPTGATINTVLPQQPILRAQDVGGNLAINYTGATTITFGTNPTGATLGGTTTINAVNGVVSYTNLTVNHAGTAYTLVANGGGMTSGSSNTFNISRAAQTITFGALANKTPGDAPFTITATASSGLAVSFTAGGSCTISGNTVTLTGEGACTVVASQGGNADYEAAAPVQQTFNITKLAQTITFAALPAKSVTDAPFTVTATASSGLAVSFAASGSCTIAGATITLGSAGSCTITASQAGNATYAAAASAQQSFTISNPVPALTAILPASGTAGGAAFTLSVSGANFVNGSVINWNGSARTTTFVSATQLSAAITAADIATVGYASVTVTSPAPGGGTTAAQTFTIQGPSQDVLSPAAGQVVTYTFPTPAGVVTLSGVISSGGQITVTAIPVSQLPAAALPAPTNGTLMDPYFDISHSPGFTFGSLTICLPISAAQAQSLTVSTLQLLHYAPPWETLTATVDVQALTICAPVSNFSPFVVAGDKQPAPAPTLTAVSPSTARAGSAAMTLEVNGTNFVPGSVVRWNGANRPTTFISTTKLQVAISTADLAGAGTAQVSVFTAAPGGGTSGAVPFTVTARGITLSARAVTVPSGDPGSRVAYTLTLGSQLAQTSVFTVENLSSFCACAVSLPTTGVSLAAGQAVNLPFTVALPASAAPGSDFITRLRAYTVIDGVTYEQFVDVTTVVNDSLPDLRVGISRVPGGTTIIGGQLVTYTISVTSEVRSALNVVLNVQLPANAVAEFVSASDGATPDGNNNITFAAVSSVPQGGVVTKQVVLRIRNTAAGSQLALTATATSTPSESSALLGNSVARDTADILGPNLYIPMAAVTVSR